MQSALKVPQLPNTAVLFPASTLLYSTPKTISQIELSLLLSLRGRLKQLQDQVANDEESLKSRLEAGAVIEPGDHVAELKENSRRSVAWKEVCIRLAERLKLDGEMYAARVLAATKPTKSVSLEIH